MSSNIRLNSGTLITSINPTMARHRGGIECGAQYQWECVSSWLTAGFNVISVNSPTEAAAVHSLGLPLVVEEVTYSGPPLIRDLVRVAAACGSELVGIINSDCLLYPVPGAAARIFEGTRENLVLTERINLDTSTETFINEPLGGFDAFFFRPPSPGMLADIEASHPFRIGDLWWDFWFPCIFLANGQSVRQSMTPLLLHLEHERKRKSEVYLRNGEHFRRELLRLSRKPGRSELTTLLQHLPDLDHVTLRELAHLVHARLWQSIGADPLPCGPSELIQIEEYFFFLRNHYRCASQKNADQRGPLSFFRQINHRRLDRRRTMMAKRLVDEG